MRVLVLLSLASAACSTSYVPRPLSERVLLEQLRNADSPATDGLSAQQAVARALINNRELRVFRRERQVAEDKVVAAGAWRNPLLRPLHMDSLIGSGPLALASAIRLFPPAPGEQASKVEGAEAHQRETEAEIEDLEARIAADTRLVHAELLMIDDKRALLERGRTLEERLVALEEERVRMHLATRLDLALSALRRTEVENRLLKLELERDLALGRLGELMGAPAFEARLVHDPGAPASPEPSSIEALEELALHLRADLRVLKEDFEQHEQNVRYEYSQASLWPKFIQPRLSHLPNKTRLDFEAAFELPNSSPANPIALAEALSDKARERLIGRLSQIRVELRSALARVQDGLRRIRRFEQVISPAINEAETLIEQGFQTGELDPFRLDAAAVRLLEARLEGIEARYEHRLARIALDRAVGRAFDGP